MSTPSFGATNVGLSPEQSLLVNQTIQAGIGREAEQYRALGIPLNSTAAQKDFANQYTQGALVGGNLLQGNQQLALQEQQLQQQQQASKGGLLGNLITGGATGGGSSNTGIGSGGQSASGFTGGFNTGG